MSFGSSIVLGIGFMIGVLVFFIGIIILVKLLKGKKTDFTIEMFQKYKQDIIAMERYEEVRDVDKIIKSLEDEKPDRKLLNNYEIESKPELVITTKDEDKTSISFKGDTKVVLKSKKRQNKK